MAKPTRLLIVDDSALVRRVLEDRISRDPRIEVVGTAKDAYEARDMIVHLKPDVITLDLEMPRMHGLDFIEVLMKHWPLPIIVVSAHIEKDAQLALKAIEAGAVEVFPRPASLDEEGFKELCNLVVGAKKIKAGKPGPTSGQANPKLGSSTLLNRGTVDGTLNSKVIVIGASTGGTEAIKEVLTRLPGGLPGIVMVQHMPAGFTTSFAERLDMLCPQLEVREAKDGDRVIPGQALLAPGSKHMYLRKATGPQGGYFVEVKDGEPVNRHKPSVDVIYDSAAEAAGSKAVGVILT
ncbi:MAG: hypothetical protein A2508_09725, partial [Candidatus Lambdaproteobacteria bacterium RIFOXYD12_FULL_49_8]